MLLIEIFSTRQTVFPDHHDVCCRKTENKCDIFFHFKKVKVKLSHYRPGQAFGVL
jgi:hypothetical protein